MFFRFAQDVIRKVFGVGVDVGVDRVGRGFAASDPVVTPLAGFAGARRPHAPGGRTPIPAAFR